MKYVMKLALAALAIFAMALTTGCSRVESGHVGIIVNLLGSEKGVDTQAVGPGRYWIGINQELHTFPTFTQNVKWTAQDEPESPGDQSITFQTVEGLAVNTDIGISYSLEHDKIPALFQKFRKGVDEITTGYLRQMVRDSFVRQASKRPIESIYGAGKEELLMAVQDDVIKTVGPLGIKVEKIYWSSDLRMPKSVVDAMNAKIAATQLAQQKENELQSAKADAQKKIAAAEGTARAMDIEGEALRRNPQILQQRFFEVWDGKYPTVVGGNTIVSLPGIPGK